MNCHRIPIIALACGVVAACAGPRPATEGVFLNASFEHASPGGYPAAWYVEADTGTASVSVDAGRSLDGARSLQINTEGGEPVVLYTPLLLQDHCVKKLGASAHARTEGPDVSVSLFFLAPGGELQAGEAVIGAGTKWRPVKAGTGGGEGCLPGDMMVGIMIQGRGQVWLDDLTLESDDPSYRPSGRFPGKAGREAITVIDEMAIALEGAATADDVGDDPRLGSLFGGAAIIGLGENSHGARGLFRLKASLVRYLVEHEGFDTFALEMPAGPAATVNDYVLGSTDDEKAALRALSYPSWQTAEMWELLEWLRAHNREAASPVTFHGLDTSRDPGDERSDDERMADQVEVLMEDAGGLIIWADNTHVTRAPSAMGGRIARQHGDAYVAVGFTYNEGRYSAYGPDNPYPVHPGYPGTHEYILSRAMTDRFLLALDRLPASHPLLDVRGWRYIGSRPQEMHQFYPHRLRDHFDVIGYVERTGATSYLVEHQF